jgi:hypothetical protein
MRMQDIHFHVFDQDGRLVDNDSITGTARTLSLSRRFAPPCCTSHPPPAASSETRAKVKGAAHDAPIAMSRCTRGRTP